MEKSADVLMCADACFICTGKDGYVTYTWYH